MDSLLRVDFWGEKNGLDKPFWKGALSATDIEEWEAYGCTSIALTSIEWRNVIDSIHNEASTLAKGQYFEIRYEDFIENPANSINKLFEKCDLPSVQDDANFIHLKDMNKKYKERSQNEIRCMQEIMKNNLIMCGYSML